VHAEVIKKEGEVTSTKLLCELQNEFDEGLRVDGHRVYGEVNEPTVQGDGGDERKRLDLQIGVVDHQPVPHVEYVLCYELRSMKEAEREGFLSRL
jgi:hypothetical protein